MQNMLYANLPKEVFANLFEGAERDMLWSCQADPRFMYYAYVPKTAVETIEKTCPVLIYIHGTGGSYPTAVRHTLETFADQNQCMILAPLFPGGIIDTEDFNSYKLMSYHGVRFDLVLLAMLEELKQRYPNADIKKVFLFGHSGGGQFVHRFFYLHPDRLNAVSISAPGRITLLDDSMDYYEGTRNWKETFDKEIDYEAMKAVPVQMIVGEKDTSFIGDAPYGSTRLQRIHSLQNNYEAHGISTDLTILPRIAHADGNVERTTAFCSWIKRYL